MATFKRATVTPEGGIELEAGRSYFIDLQTVDFNQAFPALNALFSGKGIMGEDLLFSGRGQVMAAIRPSVPLVVPNAVAQKVGYFFELPAGVTLTEAQNRLYGDTFDEPVGVLDYIAANHPDVLQGAVEVGEVVVETGKAIKSIGQGTAITIAMVAGAVLLFQFANSRGR